MMAGEHGKLEGLDRAEVERILAEVREEASLAKRIDDVSRRFLGRPYVEAPLGGGVDQPEAIRASLECFDCVTYIETVLAMALSRTVDEFIESLRGIRYADGEVCWARRNHYMTDWAGRNEEGGYVWNLTVGANTVEKVCHLNLVPGVPSKTRTFSYYPTKAVACLAVRIETGDLALFVSERDTIDVFHTGILVINEHPTAMRHASRTAGAVVEQALTEFLSSNQAAGLILLRPRCRR